MVIFIIIGSIIFTIIDNTPSWRKLFLLLLLRSNRKHWHCLTSLLRLSFIVHTMTKHVKQQQHSCLCFVYKMAGIIHTYIRILLLMFCSTTHCFTNSYSWRRPRPQRRGHSYLFIRTFGWLVNEWAHNRSFIFFTHFLFFFSNSKSNFFFGSNLG